MTTLTAVEVFCSNVNCHSTRVHGEPRFIGEDGGAGGRWQCLSCRKWTIRIPSA